MDRNAAIAAALAFHCPRYEELPSLDLYLDQVLSVINTALSAIGTEPFTGAMVSNYVKNGAMPPPIKKKYCREHLAYLMVTGLLKQVFTVQQISTMFSIQKTTYPLSVAYDYFCTEYENALKEAFCFTGQPLPSVETKRTEQTVLIRAMVLAAANRVYVETCYL